MKQNEELDKEAFLSEDRREFTRVPISIRAEIELEDKTKLSGSSFDLSLKGLSLDGGDPSLIGKTCSISIVLNMPTEELKLQACGKVVQCNEGKLGVYFTGIEIESFEHLRNLILYNSLDQNRIEKELEEHIGIKKNLNS